MKKGDMFTVYLDGNMMTICVLGFYNEEYTGEEMVILAVVSQDNMVHVPLDDLNGLFRPQKYIN
ncbi:MAG TPA: hypothetical protein DER33_10070 [Syntrophomonas sp.]|nr:hypothetical protein [Syntrophomonas sp.]